MNSSNIAHNNIAIIRALDYMLLTAIFMSQLTLCRPPHFYIWKRHCTSKPNEAWHWYYPLQPCDYTAMWTKLQLLRFLQQQNWGVSLHRHHILSIIRFSMCTYLWYLHWRSIQFRALYPGWSDLWAKKSIDQHALDRGMASPLNLPYWGNLSMFGNQNQPSPALRSLLFHGKPPSLSMPYSPMKRCHRHQKIR